MPVNLKKLLRDALDEIEREEEHDALETRFKALEEKKPDLRLGDLLTMLETASDDELQALEGTALAGLVKEVREGENDNGDDNTPPPPKPPKPPPAEKQLRPGRRSGMAYDWWVDDEGQVTKLDVARVYNGEDEPDEVEIPIRAAEAE